MQWENRTPYLVFTPFIEQLTPPEYTSECHKSERERERSENIKSRATCGYCKFWNGSNKGWKTTKAADLTLALMCAVLALVLRQGASSASFPGQGPCSGALLYSPAWVLSRYTGFRTQMKNTHSKWGADSQLRPGVSTCDWQDAIVNRNRSEVRKVPIKVSRMRFDRLSPTIRFLFFFLNFQNAPCRKIAVFFAMFKNVAHSTELEHPQTMVDSASEPFSVL